jgi:general secretion pathway protein D
MRRPPHATRSARSAAALAALAGFLALAAPAQDEPVPPAAPPPPDDAAAAADGEAPAATDAPAATHPLLATADANPDVNLGFRDAPLDQVAGVYAQLAGRVLISTPELKASVTLKSTVRLNAAEALEAIESALALQQIALVPVGARFIKAVPLEGAGQEGLAVGTEPPAAGFADSDRAMSQVFSLRHIDLADAQPVVESLLRAKGRAQPLERMNGLLITDTALNLKRVAEVLAFIDQPTESRVETRVYELGFAKAKDVASRLQELLAEAPSRERRAPAARTARPAAAAAAVPPGVVRAPPPEPTDAAPEGGGAAAAERGLLQGRLKIVADERSNVLIAVSLPENFVFFDRIVAVLDRPVEPGIDVKVRPLEYAKADEVARLLSDLVGSARREDAVPARAAAPGGTRGRTLEEAAGGGAGAGEGAPAAAEAGGAAIAAISSGTRILPDLRTNTLLLMGPRADVAALEQVIAQLDIATAQVLIEAVIIEIRLSKGVEYGIDWLQRSLTVYNTQTAGPLGGATIAEPVLSFGGIQRFAESAFVDAADVGRETPPSNVGALSYYTTLYGLNMDIILRAAASSSDAKILSTPVVQTTDNTQAKIIVGEERPVVSSTSVSDAGQQTTAYEYRNIGLELTVTPRINPESVVVMDVAQRADNLGGFEVIDGNRVPVITKREVNASIVASNRATIVLGGLVHSDKRLTRAKVPILGDIPIVGWFFRSDRWEDSRTELLVMLTPYVLVTPEEARRETRRLYDATSASDGLWPRGWTDSELAEPPPSGVRRGGSSAPRVSVVRRPEARDAAGTDRASERRQRPDDAAGEPAP